MNKLIKQGLLYAGKYLLKEVINELEIIPTIKEAVKSKLIYSLTINYFGSYDLHHELTKFLINNYQHKLKNLSTNFVDGGSNSKMGYGLDNVRLFIYENNCKIYIVKKRERKEDAHSTDLSDYYELYTHRKNKDKLDEFLKKLVENAEKQRNASEDIKTYMFGRHGWESYRVYTPIHIDNVIIRQDIKDKIIADIDKFLSRRDWYLNKHLTFKRGFLFYGKPRNGKSSLIEAISRKYKRDIYYLNLNSIPSEEALMHAFRDMKPNSNLIVEDIDAVWNKREAAVKDCKITFSTFINLMSGVLERGDIMIFFTTNHYDRLDEALIGSKRIDLQIEIPQPTKNEAEKYFSNLFEEDFKLENYIEGRSMGDLLNLFEEYVDNKQGLLNLFNNEDESSVIETEPIEEKFRSIVAKHSWENESEKEFGGKHKVKSVQDIQKAFNDAIENSFEEPLSPYKIFCKICKDYGKCTGECNVSS